MLTTKQVFNYTLQTGRDIFDDFEQLDCHHARETLGRPNKYGMYLSLILEGLDSIGIDVDTVDLNVVLQPTIEKEVDEEDDDDFIVNPMDEVFTRAMSRFPKNSVEKVMQSFIISRHFDDELLLNAPYDMAIQIYNGAMKERNRQMKR